MAAGPLCGQTQSEEANEAVLLLTATIDATVFGCVQAKITDTEERLSQYENSLRRYIEESVFTKIVFAENSAYPFNGKKYIELAEAHGKIFEYVSCTAYVKETKKYGKGYGEAMIISEALENSRLLRHATAFFKITGRTYLINNRSLVEKSRYLRNAFLLIDKERWCYTHIFKCNKADYLMMFKKLLNHLKVCPTLEVAFYRIIVDNLDWLDIDCFFVWPYMEGTMSGTGGSYKSSRKGRAYHDALCFLRAYRHESRFQGFIRF